MKEPRIGGFFGESKVERKTRKKEGDRIGEKEITKLEKAFSLVWKKAKISAK